MKNAPPIVTNSATRPNLLGSSTPMTRRSGDTTRELLRLRLRLIPAAENLNQTLSPFSPAKPGILRHEFRVGPWKFASRFTSMQNLDRIYTITSGSHPCRNGWTFHIWSHIHAESGSDGCHICKIHVKFSARAARALAMHVRNHMQNHM